MILDEKTGLTTNIMEESIILKSLIHPISINRIYADRAVKDDILRRINEINNGNI